MIDYKKEPEAILIDLVNQDNLLKLVPGDLAFGYPAVNTDSESGQYNTVISVDGGRSGHYVGRVQLKYNRKLLSQLITNTGRFVNLRAEDNTTHDLITRINFAFNIRIFPHDIVDAPLPVLAEGLDEEVITLTASNDSMLFRGTASLKLMRPQLLTAVIPHTTLNGLAPTTLLENVTSVDLLINQLNADNPQALYTFNNDSVVFGTPAPDAGSDHNTRVNLSAGVDGSFRGSIQLYYHRNALSQIIDTDGYMSEEPFTLASLIDLIDARASSYLTTDDLLASAIPVMPTGEVYSLVLSAASDSYGWTGTVTVLIATGVPINASILNTYFLYEAKGELDPPP